MYTVSENVNGRLYYNEFGLDTNNQSVQAWTIKKIPPGYYEVNSYAKALEAALNLHKLVAGNYSVRFNSVKGVLEINNTFSRQHEYMTVYTRGLLQDPTKNIDFKFLDTYYNNLMDCCRATGMYVFC